jgi:hypothetical protein
LRLFPRGWRARYGEEFLETVGEERLRVRLIVDITAGAVDAWLSAEVRRATRLQSSPGGDLMTKKMILSCGSIATVSRRDAMLGALWMIGGAILFSIAGLVLKRTGHEEAAKSILAVAFPATLVLMMPFTYLRGKSWRVQLVLVGLPLLILALIAWL